MNKKINLLIALSGLLLAGCDDPTNPSHSFEAKWSFDETSHWHACADEGCNEKSDLGEHVWNAGEITKEASCSEKGEKTFTCECGATKTEDIDMVDHTYGEWQKDDATNHKKVCSECGDVVREAHSWDSGVVTTDPTCTSKGVKTFTCSVCGETKTEDVDMVDHTYGAWQKDDATNHKKVCSECGDIVREAHSWDSGVVTTDPTCTSKGVKTFTCSVCGETKTEEVDMVDHTYGEWQKDDATNHKKVCSECGDIIREAHSWNQGVVTTDPTCSSKGVKIFTCTVCGETKTEEVDMVDHTLTKHDAVAPTYESAGSIEYYTCSECGGFFILNGQEYEAIEEEDIVVPKIAAIASFGGASIYQSTEGWNGSTKGGANIYTLTNATKANHHLAAYHWYSAGTYKETNFLNGIKDGDEVLEVISRHSATVSYCDGAKVYYSTPLELGDNEKAMLSIDMYAQCNSHGGYQFYIKDSTGKMYEWRIQNNAYTGYEWNKLSVSVKTLKEAGLANIKSIDLVAVGCSLDTSINATYAAYKFVGIEIPVEKTMWGEAEVLPNTEGWAGKTVGGATINVLDYEDRETKNLLGQFPFSGASSEKVPNFLAGLKQGDQVLEVVSRANAAGDYCDGAKLVYETPLALQNNMELVVEVYVTCVAASGYCYYVKDNSGHHYDWRIQNADLAGAYTWNTLKVDSETLISAGLTNIASIDLVAVGGYASANCTYAGYKSVKLEEAPTMWSGAKVLPNTEGWNGSTKGGATINVLDYADRETKNLLGKFPYSGTGSIKVPNFLAGLEEGDQILEVVSRCSTSTNYCDGAKLAYDTPLAFGENTDLEVNVYLTTVGHGGYCFYIKDNAGHHYDWRIQNNTYTAYSWQTFKVDVETLKNAGLVNIASIDLVAVGTATDPGLTCTYAGYKKVQLIKEAAAPTKVSLWPSVTPTQSSEGWNGSTTGGATINVLDYADRETKNLLGKFPYSGAGSVKVPNFLAGLEEGDQILEVVSRCSTSTSYCDGAKLAYDTAIEFGDFTTLELTMYATANGHSGYGYYIKDSAGKSYCWRIQKTDYTTYAWNTLTVSVDTLTAAGLTNIKSIELVAVGTATDPGLTCTYAGYKSITLK